MIIGTKGEVHLAEYLRDSIGDSVCILSGKPSVELLPAILETADLLITNDSGPSHIARAIGIPVVILAGPSQPAFFSIKGNNETVVIYHPVPCSPCLKEKCDDMRCWYSITVEEVTEKISSVLERRLKIESLG
jgi:ADP-heptose:LPS heptosyltransferase